MNISKLIKLNRLFLSFVIHRLTKITVILEHFMIIKIKLIKQCLKKQIIAISFF